MYWLLLQTQHHPHDQGGDCQWPGGGVQGAADQEWLHCQVKYFEVKEYIKDFLIP